MALNQLIRYESISYKIKLEFKNYFWDNNFTINDLQDIKRKQKYCYGTDEYIKRFIRFLKDNVIRNLPELDKVEIKLCLFDKNNIWHKIMVCSIEMLFNILKIKEKINYYKSIFVIIYYKNEVVFNGMLNFE